MTISTLGTATAAKFFVALALTPTPTASQLPDVLAQPVRPVPRTASSTISPRFALAANVESSSVITANDSSYEQSIRATTFQEKLIGEVRSWNLLNDDWDGEGAKAPLESSMKEITSFIRLLDESISVPEPMLLSSGRSALYWNVGTFYADIEFLGDGRIAYYIQTRDDKHKGIVSFDAKTMPAVFSALIKA